MLKKRPMVWKRLLSTLNVFDVHPMLATYFHSGDMSALDRCLVPEDWVSAARWNPVVRTLHSNQTHGHIKY